MSTNTTDANAFDADLFRLVQRAMTLAERYPREALIWKRAALDLSAIRAPVRQMMTMQDRRATS